MTQEELVEKIAETIFLYDGGVDPERYEELIGKAKKAWKTDAPWDTNPNELCEWERDEYRTQAREVLKVLEKNPPPVVMTLARALHRCLKATGLSLNPALIEAMGDEEQTLAAQEAWEALKMAFPNAFEEEPQ
jgi:hypothetical protein